MNQSQLVVLLFLLGVVLRAVLPYLQKWLESRAAFDWRYVVGQLIGAAIVIIPLLGNAEWVDALLTSRPEAAVAVGWFAADVGRTAQKMLAAVQTRRQRTAFDDTRGVR